MEFGVFKLRRCDAIYFLQLHLSILKLKDLPGKYKAFEINSL